MERFLMLLDKLHSEALDSNIALELQNYFSQFAAVAETYRFKVMEPSNGIRHFLVVFSNPMDASRIAEQLKLKTFAYDSILVELNR